MRNKPLQTHCYTIEGPYVREGRADWLRRLLGKFFRSGA